MPQLDTIEQKSINEQLEIINDNAPGMVYQFKLEPCGKMSFPFVSKGCYEIYGLTASELMESPLESIKMHHPEDQDKFEKSVAESAKTLTQWNYEGRIIVNNQIKWIKGRSNPQKMDDGCIIWDGVLIDITNEKQYQERLKEIADSLDGVVYEFNRDLQGGYSVTYISEGIKQLYNLLPQDVYDDVQIMFNLIVPEDIDRVMKQVDSSYIQNTKFYSEFRVSINGCQKWISARSKIHKMDDGSAYWRGVLLDITETKKLEVSKDTAIQELAQLIDSANAPIFGIDIDGKVNEWNQKAEQITGYTKDEVMKKPFVDTYITDDYKTSVQDVLDKALRGNETANYEVPVFTKSGNKVMVLLNATTRRSVHGEIIGVVGVGQDITEIDSVRKELIRSDFRWQSIVKNEEVAITELDLDLNFTFLSNIMSGFKGVLNKGDIIGSNVKEWYSKDIWLSKKVQFEGLVYDGKYFSDDLILFDRVVQNHWLPNYEDGKIVNLICISTDITEERDMKESLELAEFNERVKSEFIANMSHELRTPLNTIMGFTQVLEQGMVGDLNNKQKGYVSEILSSSDHLLTLINNILDLSKSEAMGEFVLQEVDLFSWFEQFQMNIQELLEPKSLGLKIMCEVHNVLLSDSHSKQYGFTINVDEIKFKQMMLNLLSNAINFSPCDTTIIICILEQNDQLLITVKDQGPGIPIEYKDHVFEPFQQVSQGKDKVSQGTGLGLYLVKKYMGMHDGEVNINFSYTEGCAIQLQFPIK
ncbi:hypothetical protein DID73_01120 [Candidatus Marinamargulisbacteria bacterium SCGC AG-343-K17]|nr:hypothetical protein DID73_01120 [Candidatus Marinamargulisbacteria bacterium SCGC AG-343-K17]